MTLKQQARHEHLDVLFPMTLKEQARLEHRDVQEDEFNERWELENEEMSKGGLSQYGGLAAVWHTLHNSIVAGSAEECIHCHLRGCFSYRLLLLECPFLESGLL